jgi:hypothetical protein
MNALHAAYLTVCAVVFAWATYCVLSPKVHDGIVGKLLFSAAAIAAASNLVAQHLSHPGPADTVLAGALTLLGIRQFVLEVIFQAEG